jgi:hypothetical protein
MEHDPAVIYAVDSDRRLFYTNPAWDRFAAENGATPRLKESYASQSIMDCVPEVLRDFYEQLYGSVTVKGAPTGHTYECSSREQYRLFHMLLLPLKHGAGVVHVNSLVAEEPHSRPRVEGLLQRCVTPEELIVMCSHCRRTNDEPAKCWDWVPDLVEEPPAHVSHGLCRICLEYHLARGRRLDESPG